MTYPTWMKPHLRQRLEEEITRHNGEGTISKDEKGNLKFVPDKSKSSVVIPVQPKAKTTP